jgi:outer membrane protein OmpA-like peptidoglycan-associated protein
MHSELPDRATDLPANSERDLGYYVIIVGLAGLACLLAWNHGSSWVVAGSVAVVTALMAFAWLQFSKGKDAGRAGATLAFIGVLVAGLVAIFPPRPNDVSTTPSSMQADPVSPNIVIADDGTKDEGPMRPAPEAVDSIPGLGQGPIHSTGGVAAIRSEPEVLDKNGGQEQNPIRRTQTQLQQSIPTVRDRAETNSAPEAQTASGAASGIAITFEDIFPISGYEVLPEKRHNFQKLATVLKANGPDLKVLIVGHVDHLESPTDSQRLSERRAEAAASYLISLGVPGANVRVAGRGSTEPVADSSTGEGRRKNRRLEVAIFQ